MIRKVPKDYKEQNGCHNCKFVYIFYDYDTPNIFHCCADGSKRPPCDSVAMGEANFLDFETKDRHKFYKTWGKWADEHLVEAYGKCEKHIVAEEFWGCPNCTSENNFRHCPECNAHMYLDQDEWICLNVRNHNKEEE